MQIKENNDAIAPGQTPADLEHMIGPGTHAEVGWGKKAGKSHLQPETSEGLT